MYDLAAAVLPRDATLPNREGSKRETRGEHGKDWMVHVRLPCPAA
jgi:hypothetical protein